MRTLAVNYKISDAIMDFGCNKWKFINHQVKQGNIIKKFNNLRKNSSGIVPIIMKTNKNNNKVIDNKVDKPPEPNLPCKKKLRKAHTSKASINLGGDKGDDAGHVLASRLGGSGTDHHNLFPQNPNCNRGAWSSFIEAVVAKEVKDHGATAYKVKLLYRKATDLRPYEIMGQITLHNGRNNYYTNELANPPSNQKCGD